jgi:LPS export ABC transporter permease LptG/LPS export ABC transporter permease LptF
VKILDRYVVREIVPPLLLALLIFTFILDIPPFLDELTALVSKGVSWDVAAQMLWTLVPQALGLTIPMSLLVGILVGLGRLSNDREAVALLACGVSPYRLLRPVLLLALLTAAADFYVMVWAIPDANQRFRELSYDVISKRMENDIRPQVFFQDFPNWVLYVRDVPQGGGWKDVLVADTRSPDKPTIYMAAAGRLQLDRTAKTVALELYDGTQYSTSSASGQQTDQYRFGKLLVQLDPNSVFPRMEIARGLNEMSIADLRRQAVERAKTGASPHPEVMAIQQKFSFPVACLVFSIIGLALGLTVAREGKMTGFVVGVAVIFIYYALLAFSESLTKGQHLNMYLSRWVPNLALLPFGVVALIWRARWAEGRLPFRWAGRLAEQGATWWRARAARATAGPESDSRGAADLASSPARRRSRPVVVIRFPRLSLFAINILDRYVARMYMRTAVLAFVGLLGIFYISTFIDKSEKLFKGQATGAMIVQLLAYMTPQFVYYVIPLATLLSVLVTFGILSRTSELSVMKACGISLYRVALPLVVMALLWSTALFGLEQRVMARANQRADALDAQARGRPPRTMNPLARRWLVGDFGFYHYTNFEPDSNTISNLTIYRPAKDRWALESETYSQRAVFRNDAWQAEHGWREVFLPAVEWQSFTSRAVGLESPDYFETAEPVADMMTVGELREYIKELASSGVNVIPHMVDLQRKLAFPFVTLVMTLLAIPFGVTTGRRGTLYGIGIGIVLALSYWVLGSAFAAIGKAGLLGPVLAAWAPNVIGAGAAGYLLLTART